MSYGFQEDVSYISKCKTNDQSGGPFWFPGRLFEKPLKGYTWQCHMLNISLACSNRKEEF